MSNVNVEKLKECKERGLQISAVTSRDVLTISFFFRFKEIYLMDLTVGRDNIL